MCADNGTKFLHQSFLKKRNFFSDSGVTICCIYYDFLETTKGFSDHLGFFFNEFVQNK